MKNVSKVLLVIFFVTVVLACIFIISNASQAANEYNFYFYGDKDGKKEDVKKGEASPDDVKNTSEDLMSEDARMQKLADEVAARVKTEQSGEATSRSFPPGQAGGLRAQDDNAKPTSSFWGGPTNYFSLGYAYESYAPNSNSNFTLQASYFLVRTKFLPWVTLEGAVPLQEYVRDKFHVFRVGLLKEFAVAPFFFLNLSAGALMNDFSETDDVQNSKKITSGLKIKELYENKIVGYLGAGLTLRLAKHLDLTTSFLGIPTSGYLNRYSSPYIHIRGDSILSAGLTYVF